MSLAQVLSTYLTVNILVLLGYVSMKLAQGGGARTELKLHYRILAAIVFIALLHPFFPKSRVFEPAAKFWSAESIESFPSQYTAPDQGGYLLLPAGSTTSAIKTDQIAISLAALLFMVLAFGAYRIGKDLKSLWEMKRRSFLLRKVGRVCVLINDDIQVPFSYWVPGSARVVIPTKLLDRPRNTRMAIAHELQHHRQADTRWVYVLWLLRLICAVNPFIHLWSRWISELQEFACDEALVDQGKVESQAYARCLIEVAQSALNPNRVPACATGLTFEVGRSLLKRRIEKMISTHQVKMSARWFTGGVVVALMTATAFASQGLVQDRRVSMKEAQQMAAKVPSGSEFQVVVNDLVLTQLNRTIGTPEGREFMRESLKRMETYRQLVTLNIQKYGLPAELMAIPIVESGYQNLEQDKNPGHGAGIWMFIKSTARMFGLKVEGNVDERLNPELETVAAMKYLKAENQHFGDWSLAVLSYNMGQRLVEKAIKKTGSRDAWVIVRKGFENDPDYLPKLMAAILIMNNPESVE